MLSIWSPVTTLWQTVSCKKVSDSESIDDNWEVRKPLTKNVICYLCSTGLQKQATSRHSALVCTVVWVCGEKKLICWSNQRRVDWEWLHVMSSMRCRQSRPARRALKNTSKRRILSSESLWFNRPLHYKYSCLVCPHSTTNVKFGQHPEIESWINNRIFGNLYLASRRTSLKTTLSLANVKKRLNPNLWFLNDVFLNNQSSVSFKIKYICQEVT